jgi:hypothetical protein
MGAVGLGPICGSNRQFVPTGRKTRGLSPGDLIHPKHVRQHVDGVEDGEFRDILACGVCDGALWVRVVSDR